jgi:hypothetical protein
VRGVWGTITSHVLCQLAVDRLVSVPSSCVLDLEDDAVLRQSEVDARRSAEVVRLPWLSVHIFERGEKKRVEEILNTYSSLISRGAWPSCLRRSCGRSSPVSRRGSAPNAGSRPRRDPSAAWLSRSGRLTHSTTTPSGTWSSAVASSKHIGGASKTVLTSPDSGGKVAAFHEKALRSGGWQVEKSAKSGDAVNTRP